MNIIQYLVIRNRKVRMIISIINMVCATLLWAIAHFGLRNYQYDHDGEDMKIPMILTFIIYLVIIVLNLLYLK